ncbi:thioredoxin-like protein [Tribonema minus]|uniref:Thioredoxin-like protein n=1 Tax=Tribonema minus TaxID=303371 RepID=A0A835ZAS3_9STRA|nr:thioredoxin-like protein [Tribonema minus]
MATAPSPRRANFITNKMCPYAQRVWIALEESGTPYEMAEVSLYGAGGKPAWFTALNPKGEVPVLVTADGAVIADSEAILDHLARPNSPLAPPPPCRAAHAAALRALVNARLKPAGKRAVLRPSPAATAELMAALREIDAALATPGPYACGDAFCAADASAFPFLWRVRKEFGFPDGARALEAWADACEARAGVRATLVGSWWWWW